MKNNCLGKDLQVGDIIKVWWEPNQDTITDLVLYRGSMEQLKKAGARLASFEINKVGMTIVGTHTYCVLNRDCKL